jgi:2-polyprenyl-3-methyl-5-hydroxy-6-metoxy-1,4-benzoquinol methylase
MLNFFYIRLEYIRQHGLGKYLFGFLNRGIKLFISTIDKVIYKVCGQKYLHWRSQRYWSNAQDTYRASKNYYDRQDVALRKILSSITAPKNNAIDIGCGDGRYTFIIGNEYTNVRGLDISEQLILKAKNQAKLQNVSNVLFDQMDLTVRYTEGQYDLVSCMGVTSAVVADESFSSLVSNLGNSLKPGGFLIMKDSLSPGRPWEKFNGNYVAIYRNELDYQSRFQQIGLKLMEKTLLAKIEKSQLINYIFLWQK